MDEPKKPPGSGRSTYELIDKDLFFEALNVRKSMVLLDLGSGVGDYTVPLAEAVGPDGHVYAVDAWEEGLARIRGRASEKGLNNISTLLADANKNIPLDDRSIDICLMACVLHDLLREGSGETVLRETLRILKPGGRLAVLEFKKIEDGPGPPLHIRLAKEDVDNLLTSFHFKIESTSDAGKYHYLLIASAPG
jgi:ubiquinone/menaquinone biosynthesis C-methylase UbiE